MEAVSSCHIKSSKQRHKPIYIFLLMITSLSCSKECISVIQRPAPLTFDILVSCSLIFPSGKNLTLKRMHP